MTRGSGVRGRFGALAGALLAGMLFLGEAGAPVVHAAPLGLPLPAVLLTVAVTPTAGTVATGGTQQFTATGTYSDLSTRNITASVNWSSSSTATATVSNAAGTKGRATGVAAGATTITATDPTTGAFGAGVLAVTQEELPPIPVPVTLLTVAVNPPAGSVTVGGTQQFSATGTYSDLTTADLTNSVTWSTSDAAVATVSNAAGSRGRATGVAAGVATVTATSGTTQGSAVFTVTPPVVIPPIVPPTQPQTRRLVLTPSTGEPFTPIRIDGVLLPADRRVRVFYETGLSRPKRIRLCKVVTNSNGGFTCFARIPGDTLAGRTGPHPIVAKILRRPKVASVAATFQVTR